MTPFRNRLKTPEEIELDLKYKRLAQVKDELKKREQIYSRLKSEIKIFEQIYEDILGVRIQILEDLEWQLKGLLGETADIASSSSQKHSANYTHINHATDLLDDDELIIQDFSSLNLKSLYRGVAKAVHPDLATDENERSKRQALMSLANEAYQSGNRQLLADLLSEWEQAPLSLNSEADVAVELVRIIRQIDAVQQNTHAVIRQTEELKKTDIYHFKLRVDDALADGVDLLSEMSAAVDLDILKIRRRLSTVRGDFGDEFNDEIHQPETRIVRFPAGHNCGTLYVRKNSSVDFRDWHRIGFARGAKEIFIDTSLRLDVNLQHIASSEFLRDLHCNDIQALFLYNCDDTIIADIEHLTGLLELYISDTRITDAGLALLSPLQSLQRVSIYHTDISDNGLFNLVRLPGLKWVTCSGTNLTEEGLTVFRKVTPGCKTVNFKWRYKQ